MVAGLPTNMDKIIEKIKKSGLKGRGGAAFPAYLKWQAVSTNLADKKAYIVINCAEGEPNLKKDYFILSYYLEDLFNGINSALKYFKAVKVIKVYFFIRLDYYNKFNSKFKKILSQKKYQTLKKKIEFFIKPDKNDYIAGEETALLNIIEGKKAQPRLKPPFPPEMGLYGQVTLIHNVETFASIGQIMSGTYKKERIYHLRGKIKNPGLYKLAENLTAYNILKTTNNLPHFRYFSQIGGDACGQIILDKDMDKPACGSGSITVYPLSKKVIDDFLINILRFHSQQSCGQCTPCREGTYRLLEEVINKEELNYSDLILSLKESSFCAFGSTLANLLLSFQKIRKK